MDDGGVENQENAKDGEERKFSKKPRLFGGITKNPIPQIGVVQRSENIIDPIKVKAYVQDLFYPKAKPTSSASPSASPTKKSLISQANGTPVDGSGIPCVN